MKLSQKEESFLSFYKFSKNLLYPLNPYHQLKKREEFLISYVSNDLDQEHANETHDLFAIFDAVSRRGYSLNHSLFI